MLIIPWFFHRARITLLSIFVRLCPQSRSIGNVKVSEIFGEASRDGFYGENVFALFVRKTGKRYLVCVRSVPGLMGQACSSSIVVHLKKSCSALFLGPYIAVIYMSEGVRKNRNRHVFCCRMRKWNCATFLIISLNLYVYGICIIANLLKCGNNIIVAKLAPSSLGKFAGD